MSARAVALAALVALVGACGDNLPSPFADPPSIEVVSMPAGPGGLLDVLVVVDDSVNTAHFQNALGEWFDTLIQPLEDAAGAAFDLHLGVTTSDYGTTAARDPTHPGPTIGQVGNGGCTGAGTDGNLVTVGAPITGRFLTDGLVRNYTGPRHDVVAAMFKVGSGGCGFEQPLAASVRAFGNPANAGFRRTGASLLVLLIEDEDDCSILDPAILGPESPELGPLQSLRCTRFGVTCDEGLDSVGPKHHCHARADSPYIADVAPFADQFRLLAPDPSRFVFGVIAGPPTPFAIEQRTPPGGGTALAALAHSCSWSGSMPDLVVADPAVRLETLTQQLGAHGALTSVCSTDLRPSLSEIARVARQMFGVACLDTTKLRDSSTEPGVQPACRAVTVDAGEETPLPACPAEGDCFELVADAAACAETTDHLRFVVRFVAPPSPAMYVRARCELP